MSERSKRLFAWLTLAAILVVHLRLDALAGRLGAAQTDEPRSCCSAGGGCGTAPERSEPTPARNHDNRGDKPLHSRGCPCCPQQDCSHCCIFCIYAKAPCGPTASIFNVAAADNLVSLVADRSTLVPTPPIDDFFQPPRA
jgi:hypothetical protein